MTVQEMHYAVDQGLQKVGSNTYDYFMDDEIDFWLNRAQDRYVKHRLHPSSDAKQLGFQKTQKRLDDLRLLVTIDFVDSVTPDTTVKFVDFDLPYDYQFLINARVDMHLAYCEPGVTSDSPLITADVTIVEQDKIYSDLQNPFAKSKPETPKGIIYDDNIRVFQDGEKFILKNISIDYIRTPVRINLSSAVNCELAEHTHAEIVDLAVKNMIEAIESARYQTNTIEENKSE